MKRSWCVGTGLLLAVGTMAAVHAGPRPPAGQRVWRPSEDQAVTDLSPDGKLVVYTQWPARTLMVHDLTTGTDRDVTSKGAYPQSISEAAIFSRDGRQLAYRWWRDDKSSQSELRVIGVDGRGMRTLYRGRSMGPMGVTADGGLLTVFDSAKTQWLAIVPAHGGSPRVLRDLGGTQHAFFAALSSDDKYVAYTVNVPSADRKRDIVIVSTSDGKEVGQIRSPGDDVPYAWTNGGSLIFKSDRNGAPGLWAQRVSGGKLSGNPTLLRGDLWRVSDVYFTHDGRMFYDVQAGDRDVVAVGFNASSGVAAERPVSLSGKPGEQYYNAGFSPDGKYVAFMKREYEGMQYNKLVIRSLSSDEAREFLPRVAAPHGPVWIPGQQALVLRGNDTDGRPNLYRFDLRSGAATVLVTNTESPVAISPDGRTMYYSPFLPGDSAVRRMVARNLANGQERTIYTARVGSFVPPVVVSPDGNTLIAVDIPFAHGQQTSAPRGILAIDVRTGAAHSITRGIPLDTATQSLRGMGFTADQRDFIVMVVHDKGGMKPETLWRVPVAGGPAVALGNAPPDLALNGAGTAGPWLNADATRLVYVTGSIQDELWMLDDPTLRRQIASPKP